MIRCDLTVTDVLWSVCLFDTNVIHAKAGEPIEMPFGM